jgi:hypothetical protein
VEGVTLKEGSDFHDLDDLKQLIEYSSIRSTSSLNKELKGSKNKGR